MAKTTVTPVAKWRDHVKIHPACDLFPPLADEELRALSRDIDLQGRMTAPLIFWSADDNSGDNIDGHWEENVHGLLLLDGRARLDAAERVGLPTFETMRGRDDYLHSPWNTEVVYSDPYDYVISCNLMRRHLGAEQKRDLIAAVLKAKPARSDRAIGKLVRADHKTVGAVRRAEIAKGTLDPVSATVGGDGRTRRTGTPKQQARAAAWTMAPQAAATTATTTTAAALGRALMSAPGKEAARVILNWLEVLDAEERRMFADAVAARHATLSGSAQHEHHQGGDDALRAQIATLTRERDEAKAEAEASALGRLLAQRSAEMRRLTKQLADARVVSGLDAKDEAAIAELSRERDKLREQVATLEKQLAGDPGETAKLVKQLDAARSRIRNLRAEVAHSYATKPWLLTPQQEHIFHKALHPDSERGETVSPERQQVLTEAIAIFNAKLDAQAKRREPEQT